MNKEDLIKKEMGLEITLKYRGETRTINVRTHFTGIAGHSIKGTPIKIHEPVDASKEEVKKSFENAFDRMLTEFGFE